MNAIAKYLVMQGYTVLGYDLNSNGDELKQYGVKILSVNASLSWEKIDYVVYSDAIACDHFYMYMAREKEKLCISRGEFLGAISLNFNQVIGICGCHGKTTTTALLTHILERAGKSFTAHIGGNDLQFGNFVCRGKDYFITEVCEYKKNLQHIYPDFAVVLSREPDHLECYRDYAELKECYENFSKKAQYSICQTEDKILPWSITYSINDNGEFRAANILQDENGMRFELYERNIHVCNVQTKLFGIYNIKNILAFITVSRLLKIDYITILQAIKDFQGVQRRYEYMGDYKDMKVYADYAHHPQEISAVLQLAHSIYGEQLAVVFQPHTYSRTMLLWQDFIECLQDEKNLLIYKTFPARELYNVKGSAETLSKTLKNSVYAGDETELIEWINKNKQIKCILVLGAGDIYSIVKEIVKNQ